MRNDTLILNAMVSVLILFVVWFLSSLHSAQMPGVDVPIMILVNEGVFVPSLIQVPAGKNIRLQFLRKDTNPCAGSLLFQPLKIAYRLPMNQWVEIVLPALPPGDIDFFCPSGLFRGKIIVTP